MKRNLYIAAFLCCSGFFFGQKKEELQRQNAELKKEIQGINQKLTQQRSQSKLSLTLLSDIERKIQLREKVFNNSQKEKHLVEDDIYTKQLQINKLKRELEVLRENYAKILIKAYKYKGVQNKVTFILGSKNFGEALRRVQYLKKYSDYQDKKSDEIMQKTKTIGKSIDEKEKYVLEKTKLLKTQEMELTSIAYDRQQKEEVIAEYKKNEVSLVAELNKKTAEQRKLEAEIKRIITEEIRLAKAKEEERKKADAERIKLAKLAAEKEKKRIADENAARIKAAKEAKRLADLEEKRLANEAKRLADEERKAMARKDEAKRLQAAKESREAAARLKAASEKAASEKANELAAIKKSDTDRRAAETKAAEVEKAETASSPAVLNANFARNKGSLPMPISGGQITHKFGRQPHPIFKGISEDNSGVTFAQAEGTKVKSVAEGEITKIILSDATKTIMIKHGEYFTVYSNLNNVYVKVGQRVNPGLTLGDIAPDLEGGYSFIFHIYKGVTPVDPMPWLSR